MATKFKVGDVVVLKSNGPAMTVEEIYENEEWCKCTWFDNGKRTRDQFHIDTLESVDDGGDDF